MRKPSSPTSFLNHAFTPLVYPSAERKLRRLRPFVALITALFVLSSLPAQGALETWTAGSATWDTSTANWSGSTWTQGNDALFNTTSTVTLTGTGPIQADGIEENGSVNLTLTSGTLQLGAGTGYSGVSLQDNNSGTITINSAVQLTASQTWEPLGNNGIVVNGNLTDSGNNYTLTVLNSSGFNNKPLTLSGTSTFGTLTVSGGNSETINLNGVTTLANLNWSNTNSGNGSILNISGTTSVTTGALTLNTAGVTLDLSNQSISIAGGLVLNALDTIDTKSAGTTLISTLAENWNNNFIFNGTGNLNTGTGGITLGNNIILLANLANAGTSLTVGGIIADGGNGYSLTKTGVGNVVLNGANTYTGGTTIQQGTLTFGNSTAATAGNVTLLAGPSGSTVAYGFDLSQAAMNEILSNNSATTIALAANGTQSLNFTNYSNVNFGATGAFTTTGIFTAGASGYRLGGGGGTLTLATANALTGVVNLTVGGGGTGGGVTLNQSDNYSGSTTVTGASPGNAVASTTTLTLSGTGAAASSSGFTIAQSGVLTLLNGAVGAGSGNSTTRLGASAPITLNGGTFNFNNDGSANTFAQSAGRLNVGLGSDTIGTSAGGSSTVSTLTFSGLSRTAGSTLNFTDANVGTSTKDHVIFTTAPTLTNNVLPYATVNGANFATYGANGITVITGQNTGADSTWAVSGTSNVQITSGGQTLSGNDTINSLNLAGTLTMGADNLDITSGGITASATEVINSTTGQLTAGASGVGGELIFNSSSQITVNPVIQNNSGGVVSVTKGGSGLLILSGANTYTGGTIVAGGGLELNNTSGVGTGTVTMAGGTFYDNISSTVLTNNFFFAPGTDNTVQQNNGNAFFGNGSGSTSWSGAGNVVLTNNGSQSYGFAVNMSQFAGTLQWNSIDNLFLDYGGSMTNDTLFDGSKAHWVLNNTGGNTVRWEGASDGIVKFGDLSGNAAWGNADRAALLEVGFLNDSTVFNGQINQGSGTQLMKVGTGTLTLSNASGGLSWSAGTVIQGGTLAAPTMALTSGGVTFGGSGTLALTSPAVAGNQGEGALTFTAGDGTVQSIYTAGDTGNSSITFSSLATRATGATANFVTTGGANGTTNSIKLTGASAGYLGQDYFFGGSNYAFMNGAGTYVRGINYTSDANAFTSAGGTSLSGSTFQQITGAVTAQNTATLVTIDDVGDNSVTLNSGQTLTLNGFLEAGNNAGVTGTIGGGTGIKSASGQELAIRTNQANDSLLISTNILTNGGSSAFDVLTKSGAGTLTLTGANTYTGGTYIDGGILNINADGALGAVPGSAATNLTFSGNGSTLQFGANNVALSANRNIGIGYAETAIFDTNGNSATVNGSIQNVTLAGINSYTPNAGGSLNKIGAGRLILAGANTYTAGTTLTSGTLALNNGGTAAPASQSVTLTNGNATFTAASTTGLIIGEAVTNAGFAPGTIITNINGTTITTSNFYSGTTGTQTVGYGNISSAIGSGALTIDAGTTIDNTSGSLVTLLTNNAQTWAGNFNYAGTNSLNMGTGAVTMAGNTTITTAGSGTLTEGGVISDGENNSNSYGLTVAGSGILALNGASTYTGATNINGGTVDAGVADVSGVSGAFGNGGAITFSGGTLQYSAASAATNYSARILNSTSAISIDTNNQSATLAALGSSNTGGLTVINSSSSPTGSLTLSGNNTYTGATAIGSHGTLNLTGSLAAGTAVTVNSTGTLTGAGNNSTTGIIAGAVTVNGGGALSLAGANSAQSLTLANGLTLGTTGAYNSSDYATLTFSLGGSGIEAVDLGTGGAFNGAVAINSGGAYVNITGAPVIGTYNLIDFGSQTGAGAFSLSNVTAGVTSENLGRDTYALIQSGTALQLNISGASIPKVAYFDGAVSSIWNDLSNASYVNWSLDQAGSLDAGNVVGPGTDVILTSSTETANGAANQVVQTNGAAVTTTLGASTTINSLTVNSFATSNTIAADGSTLTISGTADSNTDVGGNYTGNTAGNGISIKSGAGAFTVNVPVIIGGTNNQTWTNNSGSLFTVNGNVTGATGAGNTQTLTLANTSAGGTTISGTISDVSGGGKVALLVNDTGSGIITLSGSNTYSGGTTLASGSLALGNGSGFGAGSVALNAGQLDLGGFNATITSLTGSSGTLITDGGGASNLTINAGSDAGVISNGAGVISLIKGGAGTLALTASNGYTGTTTLGGSGILQVNNAYSLGNGGTLIFNGGILQLTAGFATSRNYVVNSGQNAIIDTQSFTLTDNGVISTASGTGGLTKNGTGTLVLTNTETYNGVTTINNGTVQLGASGVLPANTLTASSYLVLNGTGTLDLDGNGVSLTGVPTGTGGVITNSGNGTTSTLTFNGANGTLAALLNDTTATAAGTGVLALAKTGANTLTILTANSYTGGTTISGGAIQLGSPGNENVSALGTGAITITGGAELNLEPGSTANAYDFANSFTLNNGIIFGGDGNNHFAAGAGATFTIGSGGGTIQTNWSGKNTYVDGQLTGSGALTISGGGGGGDDGVTYFTNVAGANNYTGTMTINSGGGIVISAADGSTAANAASALATASIVDNSAGTGTFSNTGLVFDTAITAASIGSLAGTGSITLQNDSTLNGKAPAGAAVALTTGGDNATTTFSGQLSGSGSIVKSGTGELLLTGSSSYAGGTTVTSGTILAGNVYALGAAGALAVNGGGLDMDGFSQTVGAISGSSGGLITTSVSGLVTLTSSSASTGTYGGVISDGAGRLALIKAGTGIEALTGVNTYSGGTTINGGTVQINSASSLGASSGAAAINGATLEALNAIDTSRNFTLSGTSTIQTVSGSYEIDGTVNNGTSSGTLVKTGAGTLDLTAGNGYSGGTVINAGTVQIDSATSLGAAAGTATINNGGTIEALNAIDTSRNFLLSGNATIQTDSGTYEIDGTVNDGSSSGTLIKNGSGTLDLTANNGYTGGTVINAGTLQIAADNNLGNASGLATINNGGTLELLGGNTVATTRNFALSGAATIQVDTAASYSIAGAITNGAPSDSLNKTGNGALTIAGNASSYSGNANVNGGTLIVAGSLSGVATTVNSGAILGGTGTINSPVTVAQGGTISAGIGEVGSAGSSLTLTNNLTLSGTATLALNVDGIGAGHSDYLLVDGNLALDSGNTDILSLTVLGTITAPETVTVAEFGSLSGGQFAGVQVYGDGAYQAGSIVYDTIDGDITVTLIAVPEPGTWAMLIGGIGMLLVYQRRRRASRLG